MKSKGISTVLTTVIILVSSVVLGSAIVLYGSTLFEDQTKNPESPTYIEPDVTACMRTVADPENHCEEVYAMYDEKWEEYDWEINVNGYYYRYSTEEPVLPTAEEFCVLGYSFGIDNCMDYVILEELKQINQNMENQRWMN